MYIHLQYLSLHFFSFTGTLGRKYFDKFPCLNIFYSNKKKKGAPKENKVQNNKKIESEMLNSFNQLTSSQSRRINALIRKECCNYENGNCLLLDEGHPCICPQCITPSHIICNWFKTAVLPLNQDLSLELYNRKYKKKCEVCNKPFFSKAHNVKYCQDCRKIMNTIQSAERMRKKRCHVTG